MRSEFLTFYFILLGSLSVFGAHLYWLLWLFVKHRRRKPNVPELAGFPTVTVQLPVYNEKLVVERLIDAVAAFDWPAECLEIQILDDSTDETGVIVERTLSRLSHTGIVFNHIRRGVRTGFKAGALQNGLTRARGEFIAVFDADTVPEPAFLTQTLGPFADENVGMVQTRWEFINREQSPLCRAQAVFLDGHFRVEQLARSRGGLLFNFNGSCGVWRKKAIASAGGWSAETLTEDLELSYRAQMAGWRCVYLDDVSVPTELPSSVRAFRAQQYRWSKGAVETALRLLPRIWRSAIPFRQKLGATLHLGQKALNLALVGLALTLVPALWFRLEGGLEKLFLVDLPIFILGAGSMSVFYGVAYRRRKQARSWRDIFLLPFLTSLGVALALNNARAALSALLGRKSGFERTPKTGETETSSPALPQSYRLRSDWITALEAAFGLYALCATVTAAWLGLYFTVPF
ncbi:MAG: glycosyltransferase, partial [Candidatus Zixiibacteriota bacterium]